MLRQRKTMEEMKQVYEVRRNFCFYYYCLFMCLHAYISSHFHFKDHVICFNFTFFISHCLFPYVSWMMQMPDVSDSYHENAKLWVRQSMAVCSETVAIPLPPTWKPLLCCFINLYQFCASTPILPSILGMWSRRRKRTKTYHFDIGVQF